MCLSEHFPITPRTPTTTGHIDVLMHNIIFRFALQDNCILIVIIVVVVVVIVVVAVVVIVTLSARLFSFNRISFIMAVLHQVVQSQTERNLPRIVTVLNIADF